MTDETVEPSFWFAEGYSVAVHNTTSPDPTDLELADLVEYVRGLHFGLRSLEEPADE